METTAPLAPSEELVSEWADAWYAAKVKHIHLDMFIALKAAAWGASKELDACCEYLEGIDTSELRRTRRPDSVVQDTAVSELKEQALIALHAIASGANDTREQYQDFATIREALDQLP